MQIMPVSGKEMQLADCSAGTTAAMQSATMTLMLVDSNVTPLMTGTLMQLTPADAPSCNMSDAKHIAAAMAHQISRSEQIRKADHQRSTVLQVDEMSPINRGTEVIPLLGKRRRRSPAMRVLAVATKCRIIPPNSQRRQSQYQHEHPHQQFRLQERQDLPQRQFDDEDCGSADYATQCPDSPGKLHPEMDQEILLNGSNKQHADQRFTKKELCISPKTEVSCCRQMIKVEGRRCPPPPSKPAAKPKKLGTSLFKNKKFFVPSNLAELPPVLQSLFT
ncbi:hypothetical protein L7F22_045270 [Adiantum nelumboides]|nr:hypothetical protein [Adiantum nelumboides]